MRPPATRLARSPSTRATTTRNGQGVPRTMPRAHIINAALLTPPDGYSPGRLWLSPHLGCFRFPQKFGQRLPPSSSLPFYRTSDVLGDERRRPDSCSSRPETETVPRPRVCRPRGRRLVVEPAAAQPVLPADPPHGLPRRQGVRAAQSPSGGRTLGRGCCPRGGTDLRGQRAEVRRRAPRPGAHRHTPHGQPVVLRRRNDSRRIRATRR